MCYDTCRLGTEMCGRLEGGLMAALRCSCEQGMPIWGESWWVVQGGHRWMFFDNDKTSETYAQRVTRCRGCGKTLEREELRSALA